MPTEDSKITMGVDVGMFEKGMKTAQEVLKRYGVQVKEINKVHKTFAEGGKTLSQTISGLNQEGQKWTATFKRARDANGKLLDNFQRVAVSLSDNTKKVRDNEKAYKDLTAAQKAAARASLQSQKKKAFEDIGKRFTSGLTRQFDTGKVDFTRDQRIQGTLASLQKVIERGHLTEEQLNQVWRKVRAGQTKAFTAIERDVANKMRRVKGAFKDAEASIDRAAEKYEKAFRERQGRRLGKKFVPRFSSQFGSEKGADLAQQTRIQTALGSLQKLIDKGHLTEDQLNKVWRQVKLGQTKAFSAIERDAAKRMLNVEKAFQNVEKASERGVKSILLSWRSAARIGSIQILHTSLRAFIHSLSDFIDAASKFQVKISELQTISQRASLTTKQWAANLRQLSDAYAIDIVELTEAAYQALSNQVTNARNSFAFLNEAVIFARVTSSTTAESVNLLSSAINAFNLESSQASQVAATLFKTIELGRVRAEEMANTFGNTATIAAQVGVSLEELSAAITTITIQGVKYDTANTLINNTLLKLLKPTDAMKGLLREWGVETGQAAVETFGFVGVLRKLEQVLKEGGITELSKVFGRLRAIRGIISQVGGSAFARFEENLEKLGGTVESLQRKIEDYDSAKRLAFQSQGFEFEREIEKIQNLFTVEFGQQILKSFTLIGDEFGGLANVVEGFVDSIVTLIDAFAKLTKVIILPLRLFGDISDVMVNMTGILTGVAVALGTVKLATWALTSANASLATTTIAASLATGQLTNAMLTLGSVMSGLLANPIFLTAAIGGAIGLALTSYSRKEQELVNIHERTVAELAKLDNEYLSNFQELNNKRVKLFELSTDELNKLARQQFAESKKGLFNLVGEDAEKSLDSYKDTVEDTRNTIEGLRKSLEVIDFKQSIDDLNEVQKVRAKIQRIGELKTEAAQLFRTGQIEEARSNFERINTLVGELEGSSLKIFEDARNNLEKSRDIVEDILGKAKDKEFQRTLEGLKGDDRRQAVLKRVGDLQKQAASGFFDDPEKAREKFAKAAQILNQELDKAAQKRKKAAELGVTLSSDGELKKRLENLNKLRVNFETKFQDQQKKVIEEGKKLDERINQEKRSAKQDQLTLEQELLTRQEKQLEIAQKAVEVQKQFNAALRERKAAYEAIQKQLKSLRGKEAEANKQRVEASQQIAGFAAKIEAGTFLGGSALTDIIGGSASRVRKAAKGGSIEEQRIAIARFQERLKAAQLDVNQGGYGEDTLGGKSINEILKKARENADAMLLALNNLRDAQGAIDATKDERDALQEMLDKYGELEASTETFAESQDQAAKRNLENFKAQTQALERLGQMIRNTPTLNVFGPGADPGQRPFPAQTRAAGGNIFSRMGSDTIPAMLSPGEFVVNAQSARKFYPQLVALNSGVQPRYFADGGPVTNVGDVNVTVQGGESNQATAREIGRAIRREIKRGSLRLR